MVAKFMIAFVFCTVLDGDPVHEHDLRRFPPCPADEVYRHWQFARAHLCWIEQNRAWDRAWLNEARWCERCWDLMDWCIRVHPNEPEACRRRLAELRCLIGREAYYSGQMPPPAPFWRFEDR